jgi:hypothetical protein
MTAPRFAPLSNKPILNRFADMRLKTAFLALPSHLPSGANSLSRPGVFYCRSRDEGSPTLGLDLRDAMRDALDAACRTGNRETVVKTKAEIDSLLAELRSQVEAVCPPEFTSIPAFQDAAVQAETVEAEAIAKIARAGTTRDVSDIRAAVEEIPVAIHALETFGESAMSKLHQSGAA